MLSIVKGPYLQWPTPNSMTMMWETSEPATSQAEILAAERIHSGYQGNYKKPEHVLASVSSEGPVTIHQLTVTHLEPGTTYFYTRFIQRGRAGRRPKPGRILSRRQCRLEHHFPLT